MKAQPVTFEELQKLALKHYNEGGDGIVECWDQNTFDEYVRMFGPISKRAAMRLVLLRN